MGHEMIKPLGCAALALALGLGSAPFALAQEVLGQGALGPERDAGADSPALPTQPTQPEPGGQLGSSQAGDGQPLSRQSESSQSETGKAGENKGQQEPKGSQGMITADFFHSSDASDSVLGQEGLNLDLNWRSPEQYWGLRAEHVDYRLLGQADWHRWRLFGRWAEKIGSWSASAQVGSDGKSLIGSANLHSSDPFRQEYFLERDIVQTPMGVSQGIYYTIAGAAVDAPLGQTSQATFYGALQPFSGQNIRLHARATFVQTLSAEQGVSFLVATKYYYDTHPWERDYFSPRWWGQIVPMLQMRRYFSGWRLMLGAGQGGQRQADAGWRPARLARAQVSSPVLSGGWLLKANFLYSNTPLTRGIYSYKELSLSVSKLF